MKFELNTYKVLSSKTTDKNLKKFYSDIQNYISELLEVYPEEILNKDYSGE